ncbi:DUF4232 domain-containing protein [Conexibacter sp. S30A1]|uniref:DUF4232 domain-containing protein n=1 Tax=Conexibacter sp. S30A1 TaxID=2937800 RepID=UPI00200E2EF5|nr:DUF4232 domain-containing protein [Conexibacter sp. S30A1]
MAAAVAGCGSTQQRTSMGRPCRAGELTVRAFHASIEKSAIGHMAIALMDRGTATCRLSGVPRLALVYQNGNPVYTPPQVSSGNTGAVTLHHGQTASFWLQELAPYGIPVASAKLLAITLHGIAGAAYLELTPALKTGQQLIVSAINPGIVSKLPRSVSHAARCTVADLRFHSRFLDIGMPGAYAEGILTNINSRPCSLGGVPKLSGLHGRPRVIPHSGSQITLNPGAHASFLVFTGECVVHARCPPAASASAIVGGEFKMAPGFTTP